MPFTGFTEKTIKFLFEIGYNNSREWYEEHKPDYKKDVLRPFQDLVADLGEKMKNIDPEFELRPAVDKTISRIYRDTRFSKDKTPYRNNVWISFKKAVPDWKETPVYFFEIFPEYYHFGMGFFNYPSNLKEKLRESILENPATFKKAVSFYGKKSTAAQFEIAGETFKRVKKMCRKISGSGMRERVFTYTAAGILTTWCSGPASSIFCTKTFLR